MCARCIYPKFPILMPFSRERLLHELQLIYLIEIQDFLDKRGGTPCHIQKIKPSDREARDIKFSSSAPSAQKPAMYLKMKTGMPCNV